MKQKSPHAVGAYFAACFAAIALTFAGCENPASSSSGGGDTPVAFASLAADGSATATTTVLTLTFNRDIPGLSAADMTITPAMYYNVTKGQLTAKGGGVYELALNGITEGGQLIVTVSKKGYIISPPSQAVPVFYYAAPGTEAVAFSGAAANGSATVTTTSLTLTFDKNISGLSASDITLTGSTGATKGALTKLSGTGVYELTVSGISSAGQVTVAVSKSGYAFTPASRNVNVFYYAAPATITYTVSANGTSNSTSTSLTFTFSADPGSVSIGDITLGGNASKGSATLSGSGNSRTLSPITVSASGNATVSISRTGIETGSKNVQVYKEETIVDPNPYGLVAKWYVTQEDADQETIAIVYDFREDGTLYSSLGVKLADYTATSNTIRLIVSGVSTGNTSYTISGTKLTLLGSGTGGLLPGDYYKKGTSGGLESVSFTGLTANGSTTQTTTYLTLTFDKDITGLAAADITLTSGSTGAVKGALTKQSGTGVYQLAVSGISAGGQVTVAVNKSGYTFSPTSRNVQCYVVPAGIAFSNLTANGSAAETTTSMTLTFDQDVSGLAAADITLTSGSTGAVKGALAKTAGTTGVYQLAVSGISADGQVTVAVAKDGYAFTPASRTVNVFHYISVISYTISANGSASSPTTAITFNFSEDPGSVSINDITLGGNASKGSATLSGSGTTRTLSPITVSATGTATVAISRTGIEAGQKTVQVHKESKDVSIIINLEEPSDDIGTISLERNDNTLTFSISGSGNYSNFRWFLDGTERDETTAAVTLNADSLTNGPHRLTIIVSKAGVVYSQEISFRVNR